MTENPMSKYRAEIIDKFVNIEAIINTLITTHYFGYNNSNFMFEVLYDEHFTFGLKKNILLKARTDLKNGNFTENIGRINNIRNIFAHCGIEHINIGDNAPIIPNPRDFTKTIDPDALYNEFIEKEKIVIKELMEEIKKMKIKVYKDIEMKEEM